jgi:hypothetical protein
MTQDQFDAIKVQTIGTIVNPENGVQWEGDYTVVGKSIKQTNPPQYLLVVESTRRRVQRILGDPKTGEPDRFEETTDPFTRCDALPADWFTAAAPAAPATEAAPPASDPTPAPAKVSK